MTPRFRTHRRPPWRLPEWRVRCGFPAAPREETVDGSVAAEARLTRTPGDGAITDGSCCESPRISAQSEPGNETRRQVADRRRGRGPSTSEFRNYPVSPPQGTLRTRNPTLFLGCHSFEPGS